MSKLQEKDFGDKIYLPPTFCRDALDIELDDDLVLQPNSEEEAEQIEKAFKELQGDIGCILYNHREEELKRMKEDHSLVCKILEPLDELRGRPEFSSLFNRPELEFILDSELETSYSRLLDELSDCLCHTLGKFTTSGLPCVVDIRLY